MIGVLSKQGDQLSGIFDRSNLSIGQWTGILAAALPVIVDVTGAIGALTASAAAATAGLGALAIGGAGAATVGFGGIAAIAVPAIKSLKDLMTAQTAHNKAVTTGAAAAGRASTASAQQIQSANQAVTASEGQLKVAQESELVAQKALTLARKDAVRQLQDMRRAALESGTSEKRAHLSLLQAEKNLRDLRKSGTATGLDLRDAELSVTEARQNQKDVSIQANRAQADFNKAQKKGIDQMPGVVSAQQSLDSASRGVTDAQRAQAQATQNLAFQQKQANAATAAGGTSLAALQLAQKKAGPAAVKFAKNLKGIGQEWKSLTKAGRSDFFGMLNDGLKRTELMLPMFAKSANKSMDALRGGFNQFLDKATGPEFKTFIHTMTDTFAKSMKPLGDAFGNIAKVLQRIAVAVAPDLLRMFKGFDEMTKGWVDSTRNAKDLEDTVHGLVNQANAWWKLIKATAGLIAAVLIPGMGQGKKAVEGITASIKGWTDWVNAHPAEMRDFFKQGLETTKQLAQVLLGFLPMLFQVSKAMRPIARLFLGIVKGLNSIKLGNVSALTVLLGAMVGVKVLKGVAGMVTAFNALKVAALGAAGAEAAATAASGGMGVTAASGAVGLTRAGAAGSAFGGAAKGGGGALGLGELAGGLVIAAGVKKTVDEIKKADGPFKKLKNVLAGVVGGPEGFGFKGLSELTGSEIPNNFAKLINPVSHATTAFKVLTHPINSVKDALHGVEHPAETASNAFHSIFGGGGGGDDLAGKMADLATKVHGGSKALSQMDKVLKGISTKTPSEAIDGLRKKFGSLVVAGHEMGKKQRDVFMDMAITARQNGDITQKQLEQVTNAFDNNTGKWKKSMQKVADVTGQSVKSVKKSVGDMKVTVSKDYKGMVEVTGHGIDLLATNTNKALKSLGVNRSKFMAGPAAHSAQGGTRNYQRGGSVNAPGAPPTGDHIPAMLEKGEFVVNQKATRKHRAALEHINFKDAPRMAKGGKVGGGLDFALGPYTVPPIQYDPDHAGGNSHVHVSANSIPWLISIGHKLQQMGNSVGEFQPTKFGNPFHFGPVTTSAHAHYPHDHYSGFAVDVNSLSGAESKGWESAIAKVLSGGAGGAAAAVKKLKRIILKGPKGALTDMGQGALDKTWKAANDYIAKQTPKSTFGTGANVEVGPGGVSRADMRRLLKAHGMPNWTGWIAMAESMLNPRAVSSAGARGLFQIMPFWGGGDKLFDPNYNVAKARHILDSQGLSAWSPSEHAGAIPEGWGPHQGQAFKRGGLVAGPYVGSFQKGGEVTKTGLAHVHKGEQVVPSFQQGGLVEHHLGRVLRQGGGHPVTGLTHAEQIKRHIAALAKQIGKLDERIDIAQQLAGLSTSPGGSELSKGEISKQVALERRLLDTLRKTLAEAKRGIRVTQKAIGRHPERIDKIRDKIKRERRRKNPDKKKIAEWQGAIQGEKDKHKALTGRMKGFQQTFHQTVVDMSGLTGHGGRIFDTTLALKELKATVPAGAAGLHIQELLEFAEAMRFGAFKVPAFAKGGIHRGGLALVGEKGPEVVSMPPARVSPIGGAPHFDVRVFVGNKEITDIVRTEVKEKDRRTGSRYRAGVRP